MEKVGQMMEFGSLSFFQCSHTSSSSSTRNKFLIIFYPVLLTLCLLLTVLTHNVGGNPLPKYAPTLAPPSEQLEQEDRLLAKPSVETFNISRLCVADVSLEVIVCRNLRNRRDLPTKQPDFNNIQQAIFINISGDGTGDIRLEDFKSLFPNLVSLSITESPGSAASLINLEKTGTSSHWEVRESLVPKSLLQDPHFAKRFNLNYYGSSSGGTGNKSLVSQKSVMQITATSSNIAGRGERALISQEENSENAVSSSSTTTESFPFGSVNKPEEQKSSFVTDYPNDIASMEETNDINPPQPPTTNQQATASNPDFQMDEGTGNGSGAVMPEPPQPAPHLPHKLRRLVWPSIRILNLSSNEFGSEALPDFLGNIFPNLEELYLSNNYLGTLDRVREAAWPSLRKIDISGNPLDCTNLDWIDTASITLLRENETTCDQPPHQNKKKPILKVLHLLKKLRQECRVNCSCDIAYIWEQNHVIHSKNVVNCSNKGFSDFPDPDKLPKPTDTLDLRNNKITSMSTFVDDQRYLDLNVMTLYLDDNEISSINILEGSDWFYQFQLFSIRRNHLTEVPVYVLENAFRQNSRLLQIDLSGNNFKCDCFTVSSFKVWLLKYTNHIGHVDDVRCASTNEQIRFMRMEQWCTTESGPQFIDILDIVSIVLAILIVAVVSKVYYDYWNFKTKGKLPWLVGKM